jgi:pimeloyl-ACP methyl ester carboxylesterase
MAAHGGPRPVATQAAAATAAAEEEGSMKPGTLAAFALTGLILASLTPAAAQEVVGVEHWVEHRAIKLYVWEKYVSGPSGKKVVVLAHGSATAGKESFDLQVPGKPSYSLMDFLAREGFDVFALDTRGFGRSTRPETHITTQEASEDLNAVVDHVLKLRGVPKVNLLGWSWGTQYGGMFVMARPEKVEKYVSYAQMHVNSPDIARRRPRIEFFRKNPYVSIPEAGWKPRFYSMTPPEANDPEVVDAYAKVAAQVERQTATGPQFDMVTIMPMINPRLMPVPTLIIHGQYDDVADLNGLLPFFEELPSPYKKYVVVPNAGHMMHLQKGHRVFQHEVATFFKAP